MTKYLTRIAIGTVALFFVCVIAGAAVLKNKSRRLPQAESVVENTTVANDNSTRKPLATQELGLMQEIPYYAGQITDEPFGLSKRDARRKAALLIDR